MCSTSFVISACFSSHLHLSFWVLHFTFQSLCGYAWKSAVWSEELDCHLCSSCFLSFIRSHVLSPIQTTLSLFWYLRTSSQAFFIPSFISFYHSVEPGAVSARVTNLFWSTAWNLSWVAGSSSLLMLNYLITWLPFLSLQLDLYFGNHQSVVTADICSTVDSYNL